MSRQRQPYRAQKKQHLNSLGVCRICRRNHIKNELEVKKSIYLPSDNEKANQLHSDSDLPSCDEATESRQKYRDDLAYPSEFEGAGVK